MGVLYHKGIRYTGGINQIDDTITSSDKVWSSSKTDSELSKKMSYTDNAILGAKNLLPNNATSQTINGVTFTVNEDGSVTANGTATATTSFALISDIRGLLEGQTVRVSGCPSGATGSGSNTTYCITFRNSSGTLIYMTEDFVGQLVPSSYLSVSSLNIRILSGYTANNLTFKPMIRLATDTDDTYVPYAMTNRELTEELEASTTSITNVGVTLTLSKWGKVCTGNFTGKFTENVSMDTAFLTLPVGYRPKSMVGFLTTNALSSVRDRITVYINPDGNVYIGGVSVAVDDLMRGAFTYVTA